MPNQIEQQWNNSTSQIWFLSMKSKVLIVQNDVHNAKRIPKSTQLNLAEILLPERHNTYHLSY